MFKTDLKQYLNIEISDSKLNQFNKYFHFLIEYNKITNLTRITEEKDVYYKHFFDSLSVIQSVDVNEIKSLCDMGAGAGFPSIPIKILYPHLEVTIIDSLGKRITFLNQLVKLLKLERVNIIYDRIEKYAEKNREKFDLVTARALGKLPIILELGMPMVKINGLFLAYKSKQYQEEIELSKKAISILGGKLEKTNIFSIPHSFGERAHVMIRKIKKSPLKYPRVFSAIKKKNL